MMRKYIYYGLLLFTGLSAGCKKQTGEAPVIPQFPTKVAGLPVPALPVIVPDPYTTSRLSKVVYWGGRVGKFGYDSQNRLISYTTYPSEDALSAGLSEGVTSYLYDGEGKLVQTQTEPTMYTVGISFVDYKYSNGRISSVIQSFQDTLHHPGASILETDYTYDGDRLSGELQIGIINGVKTIGALRSYVYAELNGNPFVVDKLSSNVDYMASNEYFAAVLDPLVRFLPDAPRTSSLLVRKYTYGPNSLSSFANSYELDAMGRVISVTRARTVNNVPNVTDHYFYEALQI